METQIIQFNNAEILAVVENGIPYVAVKPISEAIGLAYRSTHAGIKNDEILGGACIVRYMHDSSNRSQDMLCLPIQYIHGWLFGIQASKVKKEVQPILLQYKRECYQVLFDHFYSKQQTVSDNTEKRHALVIELNELLREQESITEKINAINYAIDRIDRDSFKQLGLPFANENNRITNR